MQLVIRILNSVKKRGVFSTGYRAVLYPFLWILKRRERNLVFGFADIEARFTKIYETGYWKKDESVSGSGSTIAYTKKFRENLPGLLEKFKIKSILDAPCGDFNWMSIFLKDVSLEYIGADIVKSLIDSHNQRYSNPTTTFIHLDITKDKLPKADLWICRDCLFHLSYEDTFRALNQFIKSDIPYLLTTTHKNDHKFYNRDIATGDFREIDLFSKPYFFPQNVLDRIDDYTNAQDAPRELCLWSRDQVVELLKQRAVSI